MKKSIANNYFYNAAYQGLSMVTPLIITPYISRVLGADGIGIYSYELSAVTYFVLFATFGTYTYGQREISYNQENRDNRTRIFWNTEALSCISTVLCLAAYFLYLIIFRSNVLSCYIFALNIITVSLDISWVFQGMEDFGKVVSRNIFFKILNIILIFSFVKSSGDLDKYILIMSALPLCSAVFLWPFLKEIVGPPDIKNIRPFTDFQSILSMFIPALAISIYTVLDKTMIGFFSAEGKYENGYYEQSVKISKTALTIITAMGTVMAPRVGYHYEKNEMDAVRVYIYRSFRFVWMIGIPLCFGLIGISSSFVPWFYGRGYEKCILLLKILSVLIPVIGISNVTGIQYLVPSKRQGILTGTVLAGAVFNFVINLLLIPKFFSAGAAAASVMAEGLISCIQLYIVRRELSVKKILLSSLSYFFAGIVMLAVLLITGRFIKPSAAGTVILILTGSMVYFFILKIIRDDFYLAQKEKLWKKVRYKKRESRNEDI